MTSPFARRSAGIITLGLHRLLGDRSAQQLGILLYHRISPAPSRLPAPTWNVPPHHFRQQLTGLLDRGYAAWSLQRALRAHAAGELAPSRAFVVTFDDAYASVFLNAWPVLRELNVPATVFLSTAYLDQPGPFPFDDWGTAYRDTAPPDTYRPLTRDECRQMCDRGLIELGSHTHMHADLRGRPAELQQELQSSIEIVRGLSGQLNVPFAFPYGRRYSGHVSDSLIEVTRQSGVTAALTTEPETIDLREAPFPWGRFNAYDWDTGATLAARLAGWHGWVPRLQAWLSQSASSSQPPPVPSPVTCP